MLPAVMALALVFEDDVALRGAARDGAALQARLTRGEVLHVRGDSFDFYRVYDPVRQRQGYVRKWQVRVFDPARADTPDALRLLVAFVRDAPGFETLGIGAASLFFDLAPAGGAGAALAVDVYDALGTMGARLARRASQRHAGQSATARALADHLELAERFGLRFFDVERGGGNIVCEAGDAFRHVIALHSLASADALARAALALTSEACVDVIAAPSTLVAWNTWRLEALGRVDLATLPAHLAARVRLREAETLAALVFERARVAGVDEPTLPALAARARDMLALVTPAALPEDERRRYDEAVMRVAASSGAIGRDAPAVGQAGLTVSRRRAEDGSQCLRFTATAPKGRQNEGSKDAERCTHGVPWLQAAVWSPDGRTLAVPLQTLVGWRELWVLSIDGAGLRDEVLVPAATAPQTGYVELAGFSTDGKKLYVAREAMVDGEPWQRFAAVNADTLDIEREARGVSSVPGFRRASAPAWRAHTLALRGRAQ